MQAAAAPSPKDKRAFADQLAQVRAMDVEGKYKKKLNKIEVEYQFILLHSLDLFHKEMRRANLQEKLHLIKEKLTDTAGEFTYRTNLPISPVITRSLNKDAPTGGTPLVITWKIKGRSSQQKDTPCPLRQLERPMNSSRPLKNICPSESRYRL